jgi:predicted PurR-regulated permease PerM
MKEVNKYPFYIKSTVVLLGLVIFIFILSVLQDIIVPFAFAGLIAVLLNPLNNRLRKWFRLPRVAGIILTITIGALLLAGLLYFLSSQIMQFGEMIPLLKKKFAMLLGELQVWLRSTFGISTAKQMQVINDAANSSKALLGQTLGSFIGIIGVIVLIPIYVFMLLYYKPLLLNFFYDVFSERHGLKVAEILMETKSAVQSYIFGLLVEMVIVSAMNATALLLLGIQNAILLGVIGGILNMLPYIGGIIAIALPVLMATVTKDGYTSQLAIIGAYLLIQFIDNNILVPRVVSSKVKINALMSIIIVLMGGALWGVAGMFLSIPFIAVCKIIFDRIDELKPWGRLLGDTLPEEEASATWQKRLIRVQRKQEQLKNEEGNTAE